MIVWLLQQCNSTTSIAGLTMAGGVMSLRGGPPCPTSQPRYTYSFWLYSFVALISHFPGQFRPEAVGKDPTLTGRTETWSLVYSACLSIGGSERDFESFWLGDRLQKLMGCMTEFLHQRGAQRLHRGLLESWMGRCRPHRLLSC